MLLFSFFLFLLLLLLQLILPASPSPTPISFSPPPPPPSPPFFILAGDSTTAPQSSTGGGWGTGFLNTTLFNGAIGLNRGHNGATALTYHQQGFWDQDISLIKQHVQTYTVYVTIQFGHNDQKLITEGEPVEVYQRCLEGMVGDVRRAGGVPILVTPLSRRNYVAVDVNVNASNGGGGGGMMQNQTHCRVKQDLEVQRNATIQAARNTQSAVIDLNAASTRYLDQIGPVKAWSYNLVATDDHTHLNGQGSKVFGGMVALLMLRDEELRKGAIGRNGYVRVDERLERAIEGGKYIWSW